MYCTKIVDLVHNKDEIAELRTLSRLVTKDESEYTFRVRVVQFWIL